MVKALLIEDNQDDVFFVLEAIREYMEHSSIVITVETADRLSGGIDRIKAGGIVVILLDLSLPDSSGLDTLKSVHETNNNIPIIVVSGMSDEDVAREAVYRGASDYLLKHDFSVNQLVRSITYAISRQAREALVKVNSSLADMVHALRELRGETEAVSSVVGDLNDLIKK